MPQRILLVIAAMSLLEGLTGCGGSGQPSPPQPNFAVTLSAQSVFVPIGAGSGTIQASVQAVNGFNQPVSVSFSGLPAGITTSPALPVMVSPGNNQTITLKAKANTPATVKNITVQGSTGTLNQTATFQLSVASPSYAYLAPTNSGPPNYLVGFAVDANTGALTQVPGSPLSLPAGPLDVALASETGGAFVFALIPDSTTQTVSLRSYSVNTATGALSALQTIKYLPQTNQSSLAVHPSQKFLYVVQSDCILAYLIDPATGNLTQSSCSTTQASASLEVAPPGNFAYQTTGPLPPEEWFIFPVSQTDGSLTLLQSYLYGISGGALFSDPQGRALYEVIPPMYKDSCGNFVIWQINPNTGVLTNLNTSFSPSCEPFGVAFNPADTFGFVPSFAGINQPNGIYAATVDATNGNLTTISGSPFAANSGYQFGSVEPSQGKFLLEVGSGNTSGQVAVFSIDANTGALTQVSGVQGTLPANASFSEMLTVAPNQ